MMNLGDVLLVLTLGMSSTLASPASGGAELDPLPPPAEDNSNRNQDVSSAASASQCSQPSPAIMKCKEIGCKGSTRTHAFSLHISLKQCRSMFLVIQQAICNDVHINNMYGDKHMLNYLFIKLGRSDACRSEAEGCVVGSVPGHRCTIAAQPAVGALCDPTVNGGTAVAFSPSGSGASVCSNGHVVCTCLYGFYIDHKYAWHCKWTTKDGSVLPNQVCPELTASADDAARANDEAIYDYAWSGVITYSGSGRSHFNSFPLDENTNSNKRGRTIGIIIGSIVGINAAMVVILNVSKSYGTLPQQNVDANNANNNHGDDHLDALEAGVDDVVPGGAMLRDITAARAAAAAKFGVGTAFPIPTQPQQPQSSRSLRTSLTSVSFDFERPPRLSLASTDFETASLHSVEGGPGSRGPCARCGTSVLFTHHRDKLGAGQYVHTNPNNCSALTTVGDWQPKPHKQTESNVGVFGDQLSYSRRELLSRPASESIVEGSTA